MQRTCNAMHNFTKLEIEKALADHIAKAYKQLIDNWMSASIPTVLIPKGYKIVMGEELPLPKYRWVDKRLGLLEHVDDAGIRYKADFTKMVFESNHRWMGHNRHVKILFKDEEICIADPTISYAAPTGTMAALTKLYKEWLNYLILR